jgi:limonene-1,2-epoxide hydrolase
MAIPIRPGSTRRTFISGGALGAAALLVTASRSDARDRTAAEKANVKIVDDFCASWVSHDPEKIASFMADDCTTRLSETQPPAKGRAALIEQLKGLFQRLEKVEIEVVESFVIGPTVLNDRIDYITRGGMRTSVPVAGFFLVKNGKIAEWTDYVLRNA